MAEDTTNPAGEQENTAAPAVEDTKPAEGKTFTQEELDRILSQRLGRQQKEFEKTLQDAKATAEMTAAEAAEYKAKQALEEKAAAEAALGQARLDFSLRFAAIAAGVPADQVDAIVRLADTADVAGSDGLDEVKVRASVDAVLAKYPGLAGKPQDAAAGKTMVGAGPATADPVKQEAGTLMDAITALYAGKSG